MCLSRAVFNLSDRLEGKCNVGRLVLMAGSANISKVVDMEARELLSCLVSVLQLYISALWSSSMCVYVSECVRGFRLECADHGLVLLKQYSPVQGHYFSVFIPLRSSGASHIIVIFCHIYV